MIQSLRWALSRLPWPFRRQFACLQGREKSAIKKEDLGPMGLLSSFYRVIVQFTYNKSPKDGMRAQPMAAR